MKHKTTPQEIEAIEREIQQNRDAHVRTAVNPERQYAG